MNRFNFINIVDLYGYSIFDDIKLPAGVDHELLVCSIMDEVAEFEPIYTDEKLLKMKINTFFAKNLQVFTKIKEACDKEYEMIENYDRKEEFNEVNTSNRLETGKNKTIGSDTNSVSAYDSSTFTNNTKDDTISTADNTITNNDNGTSQTTGRTHGNIGVTTSQQMLESELAIRPKLNIYKYIADAFYAEFVIYCM